VSEHWPFVTQIARGAERNSFATSRSSNDVRASAAVHSPCPPAARSVPSRAISSGAPSNEHVIASPAKVVAMRERRTVPQRATGL
jgi:hypothetical protein